MASLGNNSLSAALTFSPFGSYGVFQRDKIPTSVTMTTTSSIPNSLITLFRNGVQNDRTRADPSTGVWKFYDMDDSGNQIYTIISMTPDGGATGEVWIATVAGSVVTITQLFSANRATATASAG